MEEITPEDSIVPVYLVPMTALQIAELATLAQQEAAREAELEAQAANHEKTRNSAIAKLKNLGLTPDEAEAITG